MLFPLPAGGNSMTPAAQGEYPTSAESASACIGKYFIPAAMRTCATAPINLLEVSGSAVPWDCTMLEATPTEPYGNSATRGM